VFFPAFIQQQANTAHRKLSAIYQRREFHKVKPNGPKVSPTSIFNTSATFKLLDEGN
jgi:hypothetical protein